MSIKVGFIGAGRMAQRRLLNLPEDCEPVAVFDKPGARVNIDVCRDEMEALHVATAAEAIEASDLVIVATTHAALADYGHQIVAAGKQAFVEKPGGVPGDDLPDARYGFNHRFWPAVLNAQRHITAPITHIRGTYGHGKADQTWRMDPKAAGGGELIDQGSHLIDLTRVFCGDVELEHVMLSTEGWDCPAEDSAMFTLSAPGMVAQHSVSWCEWSPVFRFEIVTQAEKLTINGFPWERQELIVTERDGSPRVSDELVYGMAWWGIDQSLKRELEDAIALGPIGATADDARAVLAIIDQAYG